MNVNLHFMYAILLTSATGAAVSLIWHSLGKVLERRGYLQIAYVLMKAAAFFWCVPLVYLIWFFLDANTNYGSGQLFAVTPFTLIASRIFCLIWGAGAAAGLMYYISRVITLILFRKHTMPADAWIQHRFDQICKEYGISNKRVRLGISDQVTGPQIMGVITPMVLLPHEAFSPEELDIILRHELTHAAHRDLWAKNLLMLLRAIHFFNPVFWWYQRLLDRWSEHACDYAVCSELHSCRNYYSVLLHLAVDQKHAGLQLYIFEKKSELRERMERVSGSYRHKATQKSIAVLLAFCMVFISSGAVYACTISGTAAANALFSATLVENADTSSIVEESDTTCTDDGPWRSVAVVTGHTESAVDNTSDAAANSSGTDNSSICTFSWNVYGSSCVVSNLFCAHWGDKVVINLAVGSDSPEVKVGIILPDGTRKYCMTDEGGGFTFMIMKTGSYKIFIENTDTKTTKVSGSYMIL